MTRKIHVLHRIILADSPDPEGCTAPVAAAHAFAAAAGAFGASAPEALVRLLRSDDGYTDASALAERANDEATALDLADAEGLPGASLPARARIGIHEEHTVLRDGWPVRWAVVGADLRIGETWGFSIRDVLTFGTGHSAVRLVDQTADPREAGTIGGSCDYVEIGYWEIDVDLDPITHPPTMPELVDGVDPDASARVRLAAALDALDIEEPDDHEVPMPTPAGPGPGVEIASYRSK